MDKKMSRTQSEAKINARAWKDPAFKQKLITNPQVALKEMGMSNIPQSIEIQVVEEAAGDWCIVLHTPPKNHKEMSEKELEQVAAAERPVCMLRRE